MDEHNLKELHSIENADKYIFIPLFGTNEIRMVLKEEVIDYKDIIRRAEEKLDNFEGFIDGIIGFFDQIMLLTFYLCEEYGLKGPSLKSGLRCEHKYWSRIEQQKMIPDNIPPFTTLNPFIGHKLTELDLKPLFWLKPIKLYGAQLGYKINNQDDLDAGLKEIREGIPNFAEPIMIYFR